MFSVKGQTVPICQSESQTSLGYRKGTGKMIKQYSKVFTDIGVL